VRGVPPQKGKVPLPLPLPPLPPPLLLLLLLLLLLAEVVVAAVVAAVRGRLRHGLIRVWGSTMFARCRPCRSCPHMRRPAH
jgi:hypothetical protein